MLRPDFLLVDLQDFLRSMVGGGGGRKKSSENDQLTGHFRVCYFSFSELFLKNNISRANSETREVNQQTVLNLKILQRTIVLTVSLSKIHKQNLENILLFFSTKQNI